MIGEEDGGLGTFATLRRGHTGEACVIAEPTAGQIVSANAGSLTFRIEVQGRSTHGSMRATGRSAIDAFEVLNRALARARGRTQRGTAGTVRRSCRGPSASASSTPATGPARCPTSSWPRAATASCRASRSPTPRRVFEQAIATPSRRPVARRQPADRHLAGWALRRGQPPARASVRRRGRRSGRRRRCAASPRSSVHRTDRTCASTRPPASRRVQYGPGDDRRRPRDRRERADRRGRGLRPRIRRADRRPVLARRRAIGHGVARTDEYAAA